MKVLHVFKDYFPPVRGGVEQHIHDVAHSLEGFRSSVLTSSRSKRMQIDDDEGVRVTRAPEWARPFSTAITPAWPRLLRQCDADVIHFHIPNPFGEVAFLMSRGSIPMIATYHADIVGRRALLPFFRPVQSRFLESARRIIVSSPRLLDTSPTLARHRSKASVIPFGLDSSRWETRPSQADQLRDRYRGPLILFLGRLVYYKGLEVLIEAMPNIEATLLIVGGGPVRANLESQIGKLGLGEKVVMIGEVADEERSAYYHAADIFVLPSTSRAEAFGIAMLEAMACGTPAISTELGTGTSWVNLNEETGLVIPARDPLALASATKALLSDPSRRFSLGSAAQSRVRTRFTRSQMLASLASLYRDVTAGVG